MHRADRVRQQRHRRGAGCLVRRDRGTIAGVDNLDTVANELYGLRPDAFAAARDEQVRKARAEGDQPLARELARLRKPSQSAWLINLLWRDQRDVMGQLLSLGGELSQAQAAASGPLLQQLTGVRRELEAGLIRRARELAQAAGVDVSASMEREAQETLAAALARPEVADEIRGGRLVKPAAYAGFGTLPAAASAGATGSGVRQPPAAAGSRVAPPKLDDFAAKAAERVRQRRAEAERRVQAARIEVEAAAAALADETRGAESAEAHQRAVADELQHLQRRLRELEQERGAADRALTAATRRRDEAAKAHATAQRELQRAEHELRAVGN